MNTNVTITTVSGEKLNILIKMPATSGVFPAVILVQGFGMDMHENKNSHDEIALKLNEAGIATIQFDFSYHNYVDESSTKELSVPKRADEVNQVIDFVSQLPQMNKEKIGLLGMSLGVSTVLMCKYEDVKSLALISGLGFKPEEFIRRFEARGAKINRTGDSQLPRSNGKSTIVSADFWPGIEAINQLERVKNINLPVLAVHGSNDLIFSTENAKAVFDNIPSTHKQFKLFEQGDHGIIEVPKQMREDFLTCVVNWFKETL